MKYRKLDENGDYTLGSGADFHQNTPECVAQAVKTRLLLFQGQWFLDTDAGVPWSSRILGALPSPSYDSILRQTIVETQGVRSLLSYSSQLQGRQLRVQSTIDTIYGRAEVST